ncbi:MAG: hypothetical protein N2C14_14980 [Planctomycetales bacterium]
MPPYMSITCSFDKRDRSGLVRAFHEAFFTNEVRFKGVLPWGCDAGLTLEEIETWNQAKLDEDWLGFDQDVSHNYRQLMLGVDPFSECRLFIWNRETTILFACIVPEDEINAENAAPLERACRQAWTKLPIQTVQTHGETAAPIDDAKVALGTPPSAELFAMVAFDCREQEYAQHFHVELLARGCLLKPINDRGRYLARSELEPDVCMVFFQSQACDLEKAAEKLVGYRFHVERAGERLIVGKPDSPEFDVILSRDESERAAKIGEGTPHADAMRQCDACFEIIIDDLDAALDEINTLMEVQGALQDASRGYLYLPWNGNLSEPWEE